MIGLGLGCCQASLPSLPYVQILAWSRRRTHRQPHLEQLRDVSVHRVRKFNARRHLCQSQRRNSAASTGWRVGDNVHGELASVVAPAKWKGDRVVGRLPTTKGTCVAVVSREAARLSGNRSVFSVHAFELLARFAVGDEDGHPAATPRTSLVDARTKASKGSALHPRKTAE
jgi:hypothetical protein